MYNVIHEHTNNQSAQREVLELLAANLAVVKALQRRTKLVLKEYSQKADTGFRQAINSSSEEEKDG